LKTSVGILVTTLLLCVLVCPALAFQADTLTISLDQGGNASVEFTYHLTWLEYFAVFLKIRDPASEIQQALGDNLHTNATVESAGTDSVRLNVEQIARVQRSEGNVTMTMPGISFAAAQKVLESYWFAPLIQPDFSPAVTTVRFPDGYERSFNESLSIPSITHTFPL
jgi:hypothetical protein